jgi:transcriptional regulator with XRE-family HTH domain
MAFMLERNNAQDRKGDRLRRLRKMAGLSQEEAAKAIGMHRGNLCMVERGNRNISANTAAKLEAHLMDVIHRRHAEISTMLATNATARTSGSTWRSRL